MKKLMLGAIAMVVLLAGCKGEFRLTKNVNTWVNGFENEWGDELAFLGCVIFPVYSFSMLGDAIIFNSLEFWTGDNPIKSTIIGDTKMEKLADDSICVTTPDMKYRLVKEADGISAYGADGKFLGKAMRVDGKLIAIRADGSIVEEQPTIL